MTVTFTQTGDLNLEIAWGDGSHHGSMVADSDEAMMLAIGRFVWWSLDDNNEQEE